jgi:hypothetical protein
VKLTLKTFLQRGINEIVVLHFLFINRGILHLIEPVSIHTTCIKYDFVKPVYAFSEIRKNFGFSDVPMTISFKNK